VADLPIDLYQSNSTSVALSIFCPGDCGIGFADIARLRLGETE
jgi:hypothetical protein